MSLGNINYMENYVQFLLDFNEIYIIGLSMNLISFIIFLKSYTPCKY